MAANGKLVKNTVLRRRTNECVQPAETLEFIVSRHMLILMSCCCSSLQQRRVCRLSM